MGVMFVKAMLVVVAAQVAIMMGIFFISAQLFPQALAGLYAAVPSAFWRTVMASIIIFPLGNWAMGYAYGHFNPAIVGPLMIGSMVVVNMAFTMAILGVRPSPAIIAAIGLLAAGGIWASLLLQQGKPAQAAPTPQAPAQETPPQNPL